MGLRYWLLCICSLVPLWSQNTCEGTPAYSPCEFTFELSAPEATANPVPYQTVELRIEFRSPRFRTFLMPGFWAGGHKMVVRFAPTEAGNWIYRITSNVARLDRQQGSFNAAESDAPGYIHAANVHHWATENKKAHLWMGYALDHFGFVAPTAFDQSLAAIEANKFNHVQGSILGSPSEQAGVFSGPDKPNLAYFDELDRRVMTLQKKRITTDLIFAADPAALAKIFPDWQSRKRFVRYVVARYGALNVTWQLVQEFEGHPNARALLKEVGLALKELDPFQHPRSTNARVTSSPFLNDGWMDFVIDHSNDDQVGAVEHQFFQVPFIGLTTIQRLWNATINGQYPELEGPVEQQPKYWFDLMADTRHWELEPYFDVDAARSVALEGIEYLVLVEKPGPIEVEVEKHGYDVTWLNPLTGAASQEDKKYKGDHFTGQEPDNSHPWVLLIAREGRKESMLKSYKFDSRPVPVQDIEQTPAKVPFEIVEPTGDTIPQIGGLKYTARLRKESRATRYMQYVWTADVPTEGQGFRVIGTGPAGTFHIPPDLAASYPAVLTIRLSALNAHGKAYSADKVYQLNK